MLRHKRYQLKSEKTRYLLESSKTTSQPFSNVNAISPAKVLHQQAHNLQSLSYILYWAAGGRTTEILDTQIGVHLVLICTLYLHVP